MYSLPGRAAHTADTEAATTSLPKRPADLGPQLETAGRAASAEAGYRCMRSGAFAPKRAPAQTPRPPTLPETLRTAQIFGGSRHNAACGHTPHAQPQRAQRARAPVVGNGDRPNVGKTPCNIDRIRAGFDQIRPREAQVGPSSTGFGPHSSASLHALHPLHLCMLAISAARRWSHKAQSRASPLSAFVPADSGIVSRCTSAGAPGQAALPPVGCPRRRLPTATQEKPVHQDPHDMHGLHCIITIELV